MDKSARKLDISFKLKSPDGRIANFQGRKTEGSFLGHEAQHFGDYEICFNNRFDSKHFDSMYILSGTAGFYTGNALFCKCQVH